MSIRFSGHLTHNIEDIAQRKAVKKTLKGLAEAAIEISRICARGPLEDELGTATGSVNSDGDSQKSLDLKADAIISKALAAASVAFYASEEQDDIIAMKKGGVVAVACDPLDGSSNIDTNVSIGTIFSIFPSTGSAKSSFFRCGGEQIAGGFFVYGPQTSFIVTTGDGTELYILDSIEGIFILANPKVDIPKASAEFAINASNHRHWPAPICAFIDDCLRGEEGPLGKDQNMRWIGSLVADANRILTRGGIFLYPDDARKGYGEGRLRLLYEANPVAFVIEQAGGIATDGGIRILGKTLRTLHQRVPFIFGSTDPVHLVAKYHHQKALKTQSAPLFSERGLFR